MDKDEAFYPLRGETYKESRMTNIILWVPGLVWFYYLICGYSPRFVSHFNPKTLIERHTTQPSFLTERDFKDGTLECKKVTNKPAVYAVTICIPDWLYASMKADPKLCNLQVLKTASFDGMGSVYLRGKIGETNGFQRRVRKYNSNDESSGLGSVFCYLRKEAKESKAEFTDWVKVWPILSGECLQDTEERIKMETRCSFLLGRDGNSGYNRL
ncbi:unnamed protein product [Adineta steineri]|uniref:Uncharacterized protein n=1 Tax=Adineta steineri TaxID=433720 RepID=A0A814PEK1_9BILA|nr:unnamed protein product [Adineta steineri]